MRSFSKLCLVISDEEVVAVMRSVRTAYVRVGLPHELMHTPRKVVIIHTAPCFFHARKCAGTLEVPVISTYL